jgi:hypothetical protein
MDWGLISVRENFVSIFLSGTLYEVFRKMRFSSGKGFKKTGGAVFEDFNDDVDSGI